MSFTPGPWVASNLVNGAISTEANRAENLLGLDVEGYAIFMNRSDAVLAAAAPEMYEALTNVLPFFNNHRHYERGEDAYQAVLAVLAKAEGKQS